LASLHFIGNNESIRTSMEIESYRDTNPDTQAVPSKAWVLFAVARMSRRFKLIFWCFNATFNNISAISGKGRGRREGKEWERRGRGRGRGKEGKEGGEGEGERGGKGRGKGVKRGWVKGVKDERGGVKVDKGEELKVERGRVKGGGK
jgi:hypothetical protein